MSITAKTFYRNEITLPAGTNQKSFLRLQVAQTRHETYAAKSEFSSFTLTKSRSLRG